MNPTPSTNVAPPTVPAFEIVRMRTDTTRIAPPLHVLTKSTTPASNDGGGGGGDCGSKQPLQLPEDYFVREFPVNGQRPEDWCSVKTFHCMHDCHEFTGLVISIPMTHSNEKGCEILGQFCSFSCALAYVIDKSDMHVSKISPNIHRIAVELYSFTDDIKPAPPRETPNMFRLGGGGLTIQQFRLASCKPVRVTLVRPPFYVAPEFMVSRPLRGHPDHHQVTNMEHMNSRASSTPSYVRFMPETMNPRRVEVSKEATRRAESRAALSGAAADVGGGDLKSSTSFRNAEYRHTDMGRELPAILGGGVFNRMRHVSSSGESQLNEFYPAMPQRPSSAATAAVEAATGGAGVPATTAVAVPATLQATRDDVARPHRKKRRKTGGNDDDDGIACGVNA
jgi:hypothetical protein